MSKDDQTQLIIKIQIPSGWYISATAFTNKTELKILIKSE